MQTIDRPTSTPRRTPPWAGVAGAIAAVVLVPLLVVAVMSKWGVLIAAVVALVVGLGIWVWQRGFVFVEIAAFLIHFDGLGAGPVRMGRILAAMAAIVLVVRLLQGWKPPAIPVRHWAPVAALTVWALVSGLWSAEAGSWFMGFGVYGLGIMFFCIGALLIDDHRMVGQFLRAYWVGGLFGSAAGVVALFLGTRSVGFGADPNFFGLLEASMIPLTVFYRRHATSNAQRWMYTLALALVLAGVAGAGSRSGLIGAGLAIVGTMVTRPGLRAGRRAMVGVGAVLLAAVAVVVGFVANPNNLQRGLSDRGAGRLDLWTVSVSLIERRPLQGYGFGQLPTIIPPHLLTTPGSQLLSEFRPDVAAHNTWLDVAGDLGGIGLVLFVLVFVVAIVGFVRPRWTQARELSTMLFVMMLPVLSGSFFLPLLNNKLSWVLIGLSASLQVPSAGARWKGFAAAVAAPNASTDLVPSTLGHPVASLGPPPTLPAPDPTPLPGGMDPEWESIELARWDLRFSRRFRLIVASVGLACAVLAVAVGGSRPVTYTATATVWVPAVDGSVGLDIVRFDRERLQSVLTLGISGAYAQELIATAGLDMTVEEVRSKLDATRPRMGSFVQISFTDTDPELVESVMPHMVESLDAIYADVTRSSIAQTEDELRPLVPGESRVYTGPAYLRAVEPELSSTAPRTSWYAFVAFLTGAVGAAAILLAGQRFPRLAPGDDLRRHIGVEAWAHVDGRSRRAGRNGDQFAQVLANAASQRPDDPVPRRIVVASAHRESTSRSVAIGLASEVAALGGRALLVDADAGRPLLSARLGGLAGAGLTDIGDEVELQQVIRRVNRRRLPRFARRMLRSGPGVEGLRFVPAGRLRRSRSRGIPLGALEEIDPEVTIVVLAPPTLGDWPTSSLLGWADSVVIVATVGRTTTQDLEDAAVLVHGSTAAPTGAVLLDA